MITSDYMKTNKANDTEEDILGTISLKKTRRKKRERIPQTNVTK